MEPFKVSYGTQGSSNLKSPLQTLSASFPLSKVMTCDTLAEAAEFNAQEKQLVTGLEHTYKHNDKINFIARSQEKSVDPDI